MSDGEDVASVKREAKAQILDMLQTLAQVKVTEKERNKEKEKGKRKWQWLEVGEGIQPMTWQMASHVLTKKKHNGIWSPLAYLGQKLLATHSGILWLFHGLPLSLSMFSQ